MILVPSDPDLQTLLRRIEDGDLDLQPDFQRGDVWSVAKRRKLIDSILRDWHVPPIHVVETETGSLEVLDGQQRLSAIRDFHRGQLRVDGETEPIDPDIQRLDELTFHDLPPAFKRRFKLFPIRVFTLKDYSPDEPAELFYRLNQQLTLTAPEQRNAFFGPVRTEVRDMVRYLGSQGLDKDFLGFSNSRMSYDDVIARVCVAFEKRSLRQKITAPELATRYRLREPFPDDVIERVRSAIGFLADARPYIAADARFNKATLFSWLWMLGSLRKMDGSDAEVIGKFITDFEKSRKRGRPDSEWLNSSGRLSAGVLSVLFLAYNDRATSRVSDVSSVIARDFVLWASLYAYGRPGQEQIGLPETLTRHVEWVAKTVEAHDVSEETKKEKEDEVESAEEVLDRALEKVSWGDLV